LIEKKKKFHPPSSFRAYWRQGNSWIGWEKTEKKGLEGCYDPDYDRMTSSMNWGERIEEEEEREWSRPNVILFRSNKKGNF